MWKVNKLSLFISIVLVLQLFLPIVSTYAAELQAPNNLKITEIYPGSLQLDWDTTPSTSSYRVYRITGETKTLETQVTTNRAFLTLTEGTYTFAVASVVSGKESPLSSPVSIVIKYPELQAPTNLQSSVERYYDLTLSWKSAAYAHYYKIYQVINGSRKLITTTQKTNIAFNTLNEGRFLYEITTYNSIFGESLQSARVEVDIVYPEMQAPTNLTYTVKNGNDITLSWSRANDANKYNIYKVEGNQRTLVTSTTSLSATLTNVPEGNHLYEVTSFSYTFKESSNGSRIEVNLIHPDMLVPGNLKLSIKNGNDGTLTWNNVDYATIYKVYEIIDGSRVLLKETPNPLLSFPNMSEGNYIYEVTSYSVRFGESTAARLEQQVVHPKMQKPEGFTSTVLNVNTIYLRWESAEYATAYRLYKVINGERIFLSEINNTFETINDLAEGDYVYEVTSYSDRFGESVEASQVGATIVYPNIEAPYLELFVNHKYRSIALWWDEVAHASSYDIYRVVGEERILVQTTSNTRIVFDEMEYGTHIYEVIAHSKFGDSPVSNQVIAIVEPILEAPSEVEGVVKGNDVVLSWDPVKDAASYNIYEEVDGERILVENTTEPALNLPDLEQGNHSYVIVPVSPSGTESTESTTITVEVEEQDTIAPVTESNVVDKWYLGDVPVELTATDDLSGVAKTFYSMNGIDFVEGTSFVVSEAGTVYFYSVDHAGNVEDVKTVELKIDETAPVTVSNVTDQWLNESFLVELTSTDDLSGVEITYYSVNGSEYVRGSRFVVSEPGVNTVSFFSVDYAGNVEELKTVEVKIDKEAPETLSNVTDVWNQGDVAVELTATDDLSGVAGTFYSINGSEFVEGTAFTLTEQGVNKVSFYSVDNAGNVEEVKTVEVKIDQTAPETTTNIMDQWKKGNVAVELTATDDLSGVAKTYYSINGSEFVEETTFTLTEQGVNKVSFYSVDNAGNVEEVKTVEVKIDQTAPETTSNVIDQWNKGDVAVELTATDDLSGVAGTFYSINGSEFVEGTTFTVTEEGVNVVTFYSVDNAGNVEEVKTVEVKIDQTAPTISLEVEGEQVLGSTFTLDYLAADNLSGIAVEEVTLNGKTYQKGDQITITEPGITKLVVTVTDAAGWTTTVEKDFSVFMEATLEVLPKVIKGNKGIFTVKAILPAGYEGFKFDVSTVTLNGVAAEPTNKGLQKQAEKGMFKYERSDFEWEKGYVTFELRGYVNGVLFVAQKTVEVK
jgi:large repetitive protein